MNIIPAIDLLNHSCVRLLKGNYNTNKIYTNNPVEIAKKYEKAGAKKIHIIDLNAAKNDSLFHYDEVKEICESTNLEIQLGGGLRTLDDLDKYYSIGVSKCILGTKALDLKFTQNCINSFSSNRIIIALDLLNEKIKTHAWRKDSNIFWSDIINDLVSIGVSNYLITDINKDGMMTGYNLSLYKKILSKYNIHLIASGGVQNIENLKEAKKIGIQSAIIGKALFENKISLEDALTL